MNPAGDVVKKECTKCGEVKQLSDFGSDKRRFAGVKSECKSCHSKGTSEWRKNNPGYYTEYYSSRKDDSVFIEKRREYDRKYYERDKHNPEFVEENRRKSREWAHKYPERTREKALEWARNNPDLVKLRTNRRRARKESLPTTLTKVQQEEILNRFNGGCALTGSSDYHMDHVIPLATGHGGTVKGNIIPLRADLNVSKGAQNVFEWFNNNQERFGLSQEKFNELLEYLSDSNGMTVEEYRSYVYECFDSSL